MPRSQEAMERPCRSHARHPTMRPIRKNHFCAIFYLNYGRIQQNDMKSPRITYLSWGMMTVEGVGSGKDFKLWPGGGRVWDWNETNTQHLPGIQPADVDELLSYCAEEIILSRGMLLALHTCPETIELLEAKNIKFHIVETKQASELYNQLAEDGKAVGGLFHSTC